MCTHVQVYTSQAWRAAKGLPYCLSLSVPPPTVQHVPKSIKDSILFLTHLFSHSFEFLSLFTPLMPVSRRLVDIRVACSFSQWPLQPTVDGGFLSRGHELETVTSFHLYLKECDTCGLPFEFSLLLPTHIMKQFY